MIPLHPAAQLGQILGGWRTGSPLPPSGRDAQHATRPRGRQRAVRFAGRHGLARLLHLTTGTADDPTCHALAEVRAPGRWGAEALARLRLAAEPTLPRGADLHTLAWPRTERIGRGRWHVHMEFRRARHR